MFEAFGVGMKIREMSTSRGVGVNMSVRMMIVRIKGKYNNY